MKKKDFPAQVETNIKQTYQCIFYIIGHNVFVDISYWEWGPLCV